MNVGNDLIQRASRIADDLRITRDVLMVRKNIMNAKNVEEGIALIEALLRERDVMIGLLKPYGCRVCAYADVYFLEGHCGNCENFTGYEDKWEYGGPGEN